MPLFFIDKLCACLLLACSFCLACALDAADSAVEKSTTEEGCVIEKLSIPSASMGRDVRVIIVLPPAYAEDASAQFPILYTLHGMQAPYDTWSHMTPLRKALRTMPMIYTCFDGDAAGWYFDAPQKLDSQFKTFFFDEFIPWVDAHYRTNGQRAVTGFSMGGYGAMRYMADHPEMFSSVSSLSGAFFHLDEELSNERLANALAELLGPQDDNLEHYRERDLYHSIQEQVSAGKAIPPMMLRCGTSDFLLADNRGFVDFITGLNAGTTEKYAAQVESIEDQRERRDALKQLLSGKLIDFTYIESGGAHDWSYWRAQSADIAAFHWKHFQDKQ